MFRIGREEIAEITRVIENKDLFKINNGLQESKQVEEKLKNIFGVDYPIFLSSGHAGLTSALTAAGIGPGDEVIVPAYTYIATAMAVVSAGAIPIIAEVDETLTIDVEDAKKKISKHTKAIIPVHINGFPCNMDNIIDLAKEHNLYVIEDACQSVGGSYKGKRLGTIGDAGAFSFNYFKIISCGEGGALLTNKREIFERALIYQDSSAVAYFGDQLSDFSTPCFCGEEYRSNELCAAVINVQLNRLDDILKDLRKNKSYIISALKDVCAFVPSHDVKGDCSTNLSFFFETEKEARAFAANENIKGTVIIDRSKHIYRDWAPIIEKRGAFNPLMDPFKMEANKDIVPDYHADMCPKTLDLLSRTVDLAINPDDTKEILDQKIEIYKKNQR
jgi:dTDP-4-amino-4,6-dideoxygalactose transaminase